MKTCVNCGKKKPLEGFPKRADSPDGRRGGCRECKRESDRLAMRRWRERNPDLNRERARQWADTHRDQERERHRRYDSTNREKRRLAIAKSRAENPEHHRELGRKHRQANIEVYRARCRAYWHRRRTGSDPSEEIDAFAEWVLLQACAYCGSYDNITIDHVVPVSRDGKHSIENIVAACQSCNSSKGAKPLDEWLERKAAA